jgi:hypothetical protein
MGRKVVIELGGSTFETELSKVEREDLYGRTEIKVQDDNGLECELCVISEDGRFLLPSGSTASMLLSEEGNTISRRDLKAVDLEGKGLELVPSIFEGPIKLSDDYSIDDYLRLRVKSVYQLVLEPDAKTQLLDLLKDTVKYFVFNYRADYEGDDAFMLSNGSEVFIVTGVFAEYELASFEAVEQVPQEEETAEDDDFGFDMF